MQKRLMFTVIVALSLMSLGCGKDKSLERAYEGNLTVTMKGSVFTPENGTVIQGGTVTWINDDSIFHTITSHDGSFNSGEMAPGAKFSHVFIEPGNNNYVCLHHAGINSVLVLTK